MPGAYNPEQSSQQAQDDYNYIHYGRIPQRVPRRFKTTKKIQSVFHFIRGGAWLGPRALVCFPHFLFIELLKLCSPSSFSLALTLIST